MSEHSARHIEELTQEQKNLIYNRGSRDPNFHKKNYFIHYQSLINRGMIQSKGKEYYAKYLGMISKEAKGIDFSKNLLIICNKDVMRDLFLVGFGTLSRLHSFFLCNTGKLMDIYYGNMSMNNPMVRDEDVMVSEQSITHDFLLLEMSRATEKTHSDRIISNVVSSRASTLNSKNEYQKTWIFYTGYMDEFTYSYQNLYGVFKDNNRSDLFQIVDATSLFKFVQGINKPSNLPSKSSSSGGVGVSVSVTLGDNSCVTGNKALDDIY